MAAILGHDIGATLLVKCDRCGEQMMAFGQGSDGRPELEEKIRAEGWQHLGGDGWLCEKCASGATPDAPTPLRRFRFGLRTLFVVVTAVSAVLAVCRAFPPEITLVIAIVMTLPFVVAAAFAAPIVTLCVVVYIFQWIGHFDPWATPKLPPEKND